MLQCLAVVASARTKERTTKSVASTTSSVTASVCSYALTDRQPANQTPKTRKLPPHPIIHQPPRSRTVSTLHSPPIPTSFTFTPTHSITQFTTVHMCANGRSHDAHSDFFALLLYGKSPSFLPCVVVVGALTALLARASVTTRPCVTERDATLPSLQSGRRIGQFECSVTAGYMAVALMHCVGCILI